MSINLNMDLSDENSRMLDEDMFDIDLLMTSVE